MQLTFHGAAQMVTGSCFVLETPAGTVMVDRGMYQGGRRVERANWDKPGFDPTQVRWLLLTHAHIDHSGLIPLLRRQGFQGEILATRGTVDLCRIMLPDSGHVQEEDAAFAAKQLRKRGRPGPAPEPLYTVDDARQCLQDFRSVAYDETLDLGSGLSCRFVDAGHILGSAIVEVWVGGSRQTKIVFSGDLGQPGRPIVRDPTLIEEADVLVMESTYGDRLHEDTEQRTGRLLEIIAPTLLHGGHVIVPSFAVERTQELLYTLNELIEAGRLPPAPTYLDSPLAIEATEVFRQHPECYDDDTQRLLASGDDPFDFQGLIPTRTVDESKAINAVEGPAIIISASGMCTAGRIRHHLRNHIGHPEDTVLFVGYQAQGTLGRLLVDGRKEITLFGERRRVRAQIESLDGFSAHADQAGLLDWLGAFRRRPKQVCLVHGEPQAAAVLAGLIQSRFGVGVRVPEMGETVEL
jgi:metallo-beta-lactamase family protein